MEHVIFQFRLPSFTFIFIYLPQSSLNLINSEEIT